MGQLGSVLLRGGIVLTVDAENRVFEGGWIVIEHGRITGIGPAQTCPNSVSYDESFNLDGHLVLPGLINAHTHAAMVLFRGRSEGQSLLTMDGWYNLVLRGTGPTLPR